MRVLFRDKEWILEGKKTVRQVVEEVGLVPDAVLVVREGELLTEDMIVQPDDEIRLIAVISGG
jgi:sulfur carrier protein ThiS